MFGRITAFIYGVACYLVTLAAFAYAMAFLGNFAIRGSIDSKPKGTLPFALAVDLALLAIFAIQHSVMARQWFKKVWTKIVPSVVERSTYSLFSCLALFLLFWKWQPIGGVIWNVENLPGRVFLISMYVVGWGTILLASFLINHFDLFGLRQVWLYLKGIPYTPLQFRTPVLYRFVRHPLYVGWLLVFWSAPLMTAAHLVFAIATTSYILIAIQFEERDLAKLHGEYTEYRRRVPMLLPFRSARGQNPSTARRASA